MYDEFFPNGSEHTQYRILIESETGAVFDAFLSDEQVRKVIEDIEES
jgi:hypothetical protein